VQVVATHVCGLLCARQGPLFFEIQQGLLVGAQTLLRIHQLWLELVHDNRIASASRMNPVLRRTQQSDEVVVENAAVSYSICGSIGCSLLGAQTVTCTGTVSAL
jgi:hypothetical protein